MKDSFNNELQVGDRVLCLDAGICASHRINQVGTVAKILQNRIIVNFDLADSRDWRYPELNIPSGHSNCLVKNEDKFIKIETHEEVEYRVGDKVLCYLTPVNNCTFVGTVVEKVSVDVYYVVDEQGNKWAMLNSEILFLLERTQFRIGDEVVVQKEGLNFELLFREGYNQSIPTRIDCIAHTSRIVIEMDDPSVGWQRNNDTIHSYWTLTNTKKIFPKKFSYSLPFVEYLKVHNPEIFDSSEQTNSTEQNNTVSNEPRSRQPLPPCSIQLNSIRGTRDSLITVDDFPSSMLGEYVGTLEEGCRTTKVSTPKLIHNYNYKPDEIRFCRAEDEECNENDLYLGIELEISGSSQESDNEEDAKEIMEVIQKDIEGSKKSVYFKHDGSINGFEIVFHPHTIKAYNEYNWKEIFSTIKKLGYTNDDKKAGFHVHISRKYFGDTTKQNEALAKMVFLMYKFKEEIEPLAGRKDSDYATYSAKALKRVKENDFLGTFRWYCDSCGKYSAINSQHKDTFELRIFDGVTDKVRFRDILNFVENLCNIVKCTSITDITKVKLEDFMPFLYSIEG